MTNPVTPTASPRPLPPRPAHDHNEPIPPTSPGGFLTQPYLKAPNMRVVSGAATRLEPVMEGDAKFLREVENPPPGELLRRKMSSPILSRQKSRYFERAFGSPREIEEEKERVRSQAMVLAEVKTNVIINDEAVFMSNLASLLARRYDRSITSVAVTLEHGVCMLFGGSFDPAYTIAIHALPSQIQPVTNKRNLALVQHHLECVLRVPVSRGLVRFVGIPEDCLGQGCRTVAGDIMEAVGAATLNSLEEGTMITARESGRNGVQSTPKSSIPSEKKADARLERMTHRDTSGDMIGNEHEQPSSPPSHEAVGSPVRLKGLRNKRSLHFIQSLFNKPSRPNLETAQSPVENKPDVVDRK